MKYRNKNLPDAKCGGSGRPNFNRFEGISAIGLTHPPVSVCTAANNLVATLSKVRLVKHAVSLPMNWVNALPALVLAALPIAVWLASHA